MLHAAGLLILINKKEPLPLCGSSTIRLQDYPTTPDSVPTSHH